MAGIPPIAPYALPTQNTLPESIVTWLPEPHRAVLLVHDMQRYFLAPLPVDLRGEVVQRAAALRKSCAALDVPVAYTAQPGRMSEQDRGLLRDFWGTGMRTDPADLDVTPELAPESDDLLLTKWRYSAFFRSSLLEWMRTAGRDQIILCGVYAHVGVVATALDAFTHDIQPFLVGDAVADFSAEHHRQALDYTAHNCGKVVLAETVFA